MRSMHDIAAGAPYGRNLGVKAGISPGRSADPRTSVWGQKRMRIFKCYFAASHPRHVSNTLTTSPFPSNPRRFRGKTWLSCVFHELGSFGIKFGIMLFRMVNGKLATPSKGEDLGTNAK